MCAKCLHEGCDDVELSPTGTIYTWTYVHVPLFAKADADVSGYGVGPDRPAGGPARSRRSSWAGPTTSAIGMEVETDLEVLRTDKEGNDVVIYRFRPVAAGSAA